MQLGRIVHSGRASVLREDAGVRRQLLGID
jgi:hypothetical protein